MFSSNRHKEFNSLFIYTTYDVSFNRIKNFFFFKIFGVLFISFFHGFVSSVLFYGFKIIYKNTKTRKILLNFGLLNLFPVFVFFWFFSLILKAGTPPSGNFFFGNFFIIFYFWILNLKVSFFNFWGFFSRVVFFIFVYYNGTRKAKNLT